MQLRQHLHQRFPDLDSTLLPGGFDRVGDIALLSLASELAAHEQAIAETLLEFHPFLRVAVKREGHHSGEFRIPPLRLLAGEQRLSTIHRENSVTLHLDLGQVYFSVRSAHERARIAAQVEPGESVAVLGSGIGPFPLIIGRHSAARRVIGIEKNPAAHAFALRNLAANPTLHQIRCLPGDAATVLAGLGERFDRILIVLPYGGERLLPQALAALRPGGWLHLYAMREKKRDAETIRQAVAIAQSQGRRLQPVRVVRCGHCGPALDRVCLDALVDPPLARPPHQDACAA